MGVGGDAGAGTSPAGGPRGGVGTGAAPAGGSWDGTGVVKTPPAPPVPASSSVPAPPAAPQRPGPHAGVLEQMRADLAAGAFAQALSRADTVLRARLSPETRAAALVLAGDAAYGTGAYRLAADRYGEALLSDELPADAPRATLALGWAELRLGRREEARRTWMRVARQFPADPMALTALVLAAELSNQAGDTVMARKLLDRAIASPTRDAEVARLSRFLMTLRGGRVHDAAGDLRSLARSGRAVPEQRRKLLDGLQASEAKAAPERQMLLTNRYAAAQPAATATDAAPRNESAAPGTAGPLAEFAAPFLDGAGDPETTPRVLHALLLVAMDDKAWPEVQTLTSRLVERFPGYPPTPELLLGIAGRAAAEQQWPISRTSYEYAIARSKSADLAPQAQVDFGEALFRTGDAARARVELNRFVDAAPRAPEAPRALYLLGGVNEELDEPRQALAAYDRLRRDFPRTEWTTQGRLAHARLLQHAIGRQKEARALLEDLVRRTEGEELAEASFRLAEVLAAGGDDQPAVNWYMAAAYGSAERSRWFRPALLGASRSLVALKRMPAALAMYRNVLPSTPLGPLPRDGSPAPELIKEVEEPLLVAEAAYQIAELSRAAGRHDEAVDMYLAAAHLAPASQGRALMGAVRSLVATGDRASAEAVFRRLAESSGGEPEILTDASKVFRPGR